MPESFERSKELNLGQVLRKEISGQTQYLVRYFDKTFCEKANVTFLGEGLRITGEAGMYSDMTIHPDDLPEAVRRLKEFLGQERRVDEEEIGEEISSDFLPPWAKK